MKNISKTQYIPILITVLVLIAVAGWVIVAQWQQTAPRQETINKQSNNKNAEIKVYDNQETNDNQTNASEKEVDTMDFGLSKTDTDFCTASPRPTEIGRDVYPINKEKYGDIGFLGELFTADDCDKERVSKIFGVEGELYTLMPDIGLKNYPTIELILVLREIGFEYGDACDTKMAATLCTHWTLMKIIPIDTILNLKPFATQIRSSGCINCG